jgi:hypothetical protein
MDSGTERLIGICMLLHELTQKNRLLEEIRGRDEDSGEVHDGSA